MPYADGEEGEAREAESYPGRLRILLLALAAAALVVPAPATSVPTSIATSSPTSTQALTADPASGNPTLVPASGNPSLIPPPDDPSLVTASGNPSLVPASGNPSLVPASGNPTRAPTAAPPRTAPPTAAPPAHPAGANSVPATINATCASNVSPALNAWIASRPDGSTLTFPSGACYRLGGDQGIIIKGRNNLTLVGTGSTLQLRTTGASNYSTGLFVENSDHITFRGFTVDGGNTATGTTGAAAAVNEGMSGAMVRSGSDFVEFDHVTWDHLYGFGILTTDLGGGVWPSDISIHDSTIRGGEMGVAIVAGRRIRIERNAINDTVLIPFDLEPDRTTHGFQDVLISDNDITRYGWGQYTTSWFVAANPADAVVSSAIMDRLTVTGNRVHVGAATADNGNADGLGGLGIRADKANLKRDFVFTNNWTVDNDIRSSTRFVMNLANVQNLTVTGNRQPITNGSRFLIDVNTTGRRVVSGNDTSP
jgi:hypothetical protein